MSMLSVILVLIVLILLTVAIITLIIVYRGKNCETGNCSPSCSSSSSSPCHTGVTGTNDDPQEPQEEPLSVPLSLPESDPLPVPRANHQIPNASSIQQLTRINNVDLKYNVAQLFSKTAKSQKLNFDKTTVKPEQVVTQFEVGDKRREQIEFVIKKKELVVEQNPISTSDAIDWRNIGILHKDMFNRFYRNPAGSKDYSAFESQLLEPLQAIVIPRAPAIIDQLDLSVENYMQKVSNNAEQRSQAQTDFFAEVTSILKPENLEGDTQLMLAEAMAEIKSGFSQSDSTELDYAALKKFYKQVKEELNLNLPASAYTNRIFSEPNSILQAAFVDSVATFVNCVQQKPEQKLECFLEWQDLLQSYVSILVI